MGAKHLALRLMAPVVASDAVHRLSISYAPFLSFISFFFLMSAGQPRGRVENI
jgi:hypothetical protein